MGINKSWSDVKVTPKQFVVDECPEDYEFRAKLFNRLTRSNDGR